jgi:hypothetical protein
MDKLASDGLCWAESTEQILTLTNCHSWLAFAQRVALRPRDFEALTPQFLAYPSCTNSSRAYMATLILALTARLIT